MYGGPYSIGCIKRVRYATMYGGPYSIGCVKLRRDATMHGGQYNIGCIKLGRYAQCMEVHIVQGVSNVEGMHNAWRSI